MPRCHAVLSPLIAAGLLLLARSSFASGQSADEWRAQQLAAADRSELIMARANRQHTPLQQYQVMLDAAISAKPEDRAFKLIFNQYLSWYQTFIGDYPDAALSFSVGEPMQSGDKPAPLDGYTAKPAIEVIARLAHGRRAVFLNEAHNLPETRSLTVPLLARLRQDGFNTLAVETLYSTDTKLAERGYVTAKSGFYTREPVYAQMVRTALKLGFKVVAYEADEAQMGEARERDQARKLNRLLSDQEVRLVVNAGYGHIQESGAYLGGKSMAQYLRILSNVDPLTVEQTMLIAHPEAAMDHPDYTAIRHAPGIVFDQPLVFVDKAGAPWSLRKGYEVSVFFPPPRLRLGRPTWLTLGGLRKPYFVSGDSDCQQHFPCLAQARYAGDGEDAIDADLMLLDPLLEGTQTSTRVNLTPAQRDGYLYLRPGSYQLRTRDSAGHTLGSRAITVQP